MFVILAILNVCCLVLSTYVINISVRYCYVLKHFIWNVVWWGGEGGSGPQWGRGYPNAFDVGPTSRNEGGRTSFPTEGRRLADAVLHNID